MSYFLRALIAAVLVGGLEWKSLRKESRATWVVVGLLLLLSAVMYQRANTDPMTIRPAARLIQILEPFSPIK